jgi:hypothetical protein
MSPLIPLWYNVLKNNTSSERKVNIGDCKVSRSTYTKHLGISRNEKNSINIDEKLK